MERFLLFDSGCSVCTELAHAIQRETDGQLKARSLREPEVKALLDRARPGWRWEPTLLEVAGDHVRAFTGLAMRLRLLVGLGPRRTWRIARLVSHAGVPLVDLASERRGFLKQTAMFVTGLFFLPWSRPGTQPPGLPPQQGPSKHPFAKLKIVRRTEVTGADLERIQKDIPARPDVQNILRQTGVSPQWKEMRAVRHEAADGNVLLAVAVQVGTDTLGYFELARPVDYFHTEAKLFHLKDEKELSLIGRSLNNKVLPLEPAIGSGVTPMITCDGCPYNQACWGCTQWNWDCIIGDCSACFIACLGGPVACVVCFLIWCPFVVFLRCCLNEYETCCPCGGGG